MKIPKGLIMGTIGEIDALVSYVKDPRVRYIHMNNILVKLIETYEREKDK